MAFTKTYHLCSTSEFFHPSPDGPISLGSIIHSTNSPQTSLNKGHVIPLADGSQSTVETNWTKTISAKTGLGIGVYAKFLEFVTGGASLVPGVDVEISRETQQMYAFDSMTTVSFEPTQDYIDQAVNTPMVQAWLRQPRQVFSRVAYLFLITGMKVVKGAKFKFSHSNSTSVKGRVGIDMAPAGVSFGTGPGSHWSSSNGDETSFSRDTEFVFAFRVKRLRFGQDVRAEDYNQGAFLAVETGNNDDVSVSAENIDGSELDSAVLVYDATEDGSVYCIPPHRGI